MILIADAGSTKTQWIEVDEGRRRSFTTEGINPALLSPEELHMKLTEALAGMVFAPDDAIYYYGAGCVSELYDTVRECLASVTGCKYIEVNSDMIGAARAVCGDAPGIVAILGTGSNSCYYDGRQVIANTPPLGYILGDEGSGAKLGARLLNGVLKAYLPESVRLKFFESTGLDKYSVIDRVYRQTDANVFLASLVPFIKAHIDVEASLDDMVVSEFELFLDRNIAHAYDLSGGTIHFIGSIADVFSIQLKVALRRFGLRPGIIAARPLPLLADYHINRFISNE